MTFKGHSHTEETKKKISLKNQKPLVCRKCGVPLSKENRYPSLEKQKQRVCNSCCYLYYQKPFVERHRKEINEKEKLYKRKHHIATNDWVYQSKAEINRPEVCSICGTNHAQAAINFHHWQENPLVGMWVCRKCHNIIHLKVKGGGELPLTIEEWYRRYEQLKATPIIINAKPIKKGRKYYRMKAGGALNA